MRQRLSITARPSRGPHEHTSSKSRCAAWTWVEPSLSPMLTIEQVAALDAADHLRLARRKSSRPRPPRQCTVGAGYYVASDRRVPALRLSGHWLEQLGFAIGSRLNLVMREGELIVTLAKRDGSS